MRRETSGAAKAWAGACLALSDFLVFEHFIKVDVALDLKFREGNSVD